jgi:hypothetical protein
MERLKCLALALVIGAAFCPTVAGAQSSAQPYYMLGYHSQDDLLNHEAEASDPAGIHKYSEQLIGLLLPEDVVDGYKDSLSDRLARAEQMAREGKGKLVPEADVARSFNDLMKRIGSSFRTDEASVRKFRAHSIAVPALPALLSADRNGAYCNPGEAVYLLYLLMLYNGAAIPDHYLEGIQALRHEDDLVGQTGRTSGPVRTVVLGTPVGTDTYARGQLLSYSLQHNRRATIKVLNALSKTLGF